MTLGELEQEVGGTRIGLRTAIHGFRVYVRPVHGPRWRADFGKHTRLCDARSIQAGLLVEYEPFPDTVVPGHGRLRVTARLTVDPDGSAVALSLDAAEDFPMTELVSPVLLLDEAVDSPYDFLIPDGEGLILAGDGTGPGQRERVAFHDHRITLPMTALLSRSGPFLLVTAVSGHDHATTPLPATKTTPSLGLVNLATLGTWGYRREWRITAGVGGLAAVATAVAEDLRNGGYPLASQSEKLSRSEVPMRLRKNVGGSVLWCHFDTLRAEIADDLRGAGARSVMLMGRPVDDRARDAILAAGYASGPYFQAFDLFPPGSVTELGWRNTYPPEGSSDGWPESLIRDREGWLDAGWTYLPYPSGEHFWDDETYLTSDGRVRHRERASHDQLPVLSYRRCPSKHLGVVRRHGLPMLEREGATAAFIDIVAAMWGLECYSSAHPCSRRDDVQYRRSVLDELGQQKRILHTEAGKWWAIDKVNAFEGLFSYDQELGPANYQLVDYPEDTSRRAFEFNLGHRVPLFGMVANHAVARTMWWGTGQDRHTSTCGAKDAITALFGANPIYVVDPDHPLHPGSPRWDAVTSTITTFDMLRDLTLDARVTGYSSDGQVGRTEFEGGVSVEANVGFTVVSGLEPGEVLLRDGAGRLVHRHLGAQT